MFSKILTGLRRHPLATQILANTGWLGAEHVIRLGAAVVVMVLLARYLGPQGFGLFSFATAFVMLFRHLAILGLSGIVVRELVAHEREQTAVMGAAVGARLVGGAAAAILVVVLASTMELGQADARALVAVMALLLPLSAFDALELPFQAQVRSKPAVLAKGGAFIAGAVIKIALIVWQAPLIAFAWATVAEVALIAIALSIALVRQGWDVLGLRVEWARAGRLLGESWPLILSGIGAVLNLRVDQIMLGSMADATEVGIYAAAAQLSEAWYFVPAAIAASAFPSLIATRMQDDVLYRRRLQRLYDGLVSTAFAIAVGITLVAAPLVSVLYGADFAGASAILSIHIWGGVFMFPRSASSKWLVAEGLVMFSLVSHGFGALVNILANWMLIPVAGGVGAAWATLLSYAVSSLFAFMIHPATRPPAVMTLKAFVAPWRLVRHGTWRDLAG